MRFEHVVGMQSTVMALFWDHPVYPTRLLNRLE